MSDSHFRERLRRWLEHRAVELCHAGVGADELDRVLRALERARGGDFGRCVECDLPIARERLSLEPCAERCFACEARHARREAAERTDFEAHGH